MVMRSTAAAFSMLLFLGCFNTSEAKEKNVCKGLSQTDCPTKVECYWVADKNGCKPKNPKGSDGAPDQAPKAQ